MGPGSMGSGSTGSTAGEEPNLSIAVVRLMQGVVYRDGPGNVWSSLIGLHTAVRDYVRVLGLELVLDEAEGYAFLRSRPDDADDPTSLPRLVPRHRLSLHVSVLLALLRKKLAEFDASDGGTKLVLSRDQIVELVRVFMPATSTEKRLVDQIDTHIGKVVDLGYLRRLPNQPGLFEVRRILKAFVDAQWLADLATLLERYADELDGTPGSGSPAESDASGDDGETVS